MGEGQFRCEGGLMSVGDLEGSRVVVGGNVDRDDALYFNTTGILEV